MNATTINVSNRNALLAALRKSSDPKNLNLKKKKQTKFFLADLDGEIWAPVLNWETLYHVSNLGRVKSLLRVIDTTDGKTMTKPETLMEGSVDEEGKKSFHLSSIELEKNERVVYLSDMQAVFSQ